jgi:predicted HAD superfamily phosphohydrolase YqeG
MTTYERLSEPDDVLRRVVDIAPRTVIFDVEPLVAFWDTDQASLDAGIGSTLERLRDVSAIEVIVFATNSVRRPSVIANGRPGTRVLYYAAARKPLRTKPYRSLPRDGVVVGDQVATDGLLARRLGYTFLHYEPPRATMSRGPRAMRMLGRPLRTILFTR